MRVYVWREGIKSLQYLRNQMNCVLYIDPGNTKANSAGRTMKRWAGSRYL